MLNLKRSFYNLPILHPQTVKNEKEESPEGGEPLDNPIQSGAENASDQ